MRDSAVVVLSLIIVVMLMRESYIAGAEQGYWDAIDEENEYACELQIRTIESIRVLK